MKQNPYIHGLYLNFFLPLYRKNQIHFDKDLFSKSEILDILGQEKDSFQRLTQYAGNLIDYSIEDLKILVVGTGSGVLASQLFERLDPHELIEIDINPSVIDRRIKHNHNSRRVAKLINVESMPFEDGYFHLVIAYGVMRYVHDIERSLHEMARVMHPQGLIVVGEGRKADIIQNRAAHRFPKYKEGTRGPKQRSTSEPYLCLCTDRTIQGKQRQSFQIDDPRDQKE